VDGILVLDLPPEESAEMTAACKQQGVDQIFLIAPTTPEARIPIITRDASGFVYYVSREGVTGERSDVATDIASRVAAIRSHTSVPIGIGFGISNAAQVREVAQYGDAVIVGSSLVKVIEQHASSPSTLVPELKAKVTAMLSGLDPA
jgi:tryptophan synthase alpha chain